MVKIGLIGGSGLEDPEILQGASEINTETPYGKTSSGLLDGSISGVKVCLLSRHGRDHTIPPSQVNNRANIWALKNNNCSHIIATTACGSLREEFKRGDLVIPDQFIDLTRHRKITFYDSFEPGNMKHTPMAEPFNRSLREILIKQGIRLGYSLHYAGTIITIEGPRFSTRAESKMYRIWGADLVNMSTAPEVILSNEIGIPYACIAMSTDFDSWKEDEDPVSWEDVIKVFGQNVKKVLNLIIKSLAEFN